MNAEKTKKSTLMKMFEGISKVPIWAWMIILSITSAFSSIFQTSLVVNSYESIYQVLSSKTLFVIVLVSVAVVFPLLIRLFARLDYSISSRIYFRRTINVPDYNLRKLPIPYNDFLRVVLFVYSISNIVKGCLSVCIIAYPFMIYLLKIPEFIVKIGMFILGALILSVREESNKIDYRKEGKRLSFPSFCS